MIPSERTELGAGRAPRPVDLHRRHPVGAVEDRATGRRRSAIRSGYRGDGRRRARDVHARAAVALGRCRRSRRRSPRCRQSRCPSRHRRRCRSARQAARSTWCTCSSPGRSRAGARRNARVRAGAREVRLCRHALVELRVDRVSAHSPLSAVVSTLQKTGSRTPERVVNWVLLLQASHFGFCVWIPNWLSSPARWASCRS